MDGSEAVFISHVCVRLILESIIFGLSGALSVQLTPLNLQRGYRYEE